MTCVLVIDGDRSARTAIQTVLESEGFEVVTTDGNGGGMPRDLITAVVTFVGRRSNGIGGAIRRTRRKGSPATDPAIARRRIAAIRDGPAAFDLISGRHRMRRARNP
jgi:CheY-like chemotaxis protein